MKVFELLIDIIQKTRNESYLEVVFDDGKELIPFKEVFEIKKDKGFLLIKNKKK